MTALKAIIMAGGMGTRLRPVCSDMPKPMTRLLGIPLLEHIIELLRQHGITRLCLTLAYLPEIIVKHFGDGSDFGVSIEYRIEESPLGTAGGVLACEDFYGGEDFLVVSGDCACDFDLSLLIREHALRRADMTMALCPHSEPLRYGTVLTDRQGNILSFIEKPRWEQVVTDLVNTGIYIISPRVMSLVPRGQAFDFARQLFPLMEQNGLKIQGVPMEGYWCDIGDPKSYYTCCMDALSGKLNLPLALSRRAFQRESADIADSALIVSPSVICKGAIVERGAVVANSIIHPQSRIGAYSRIINSVIDGGAVEEACIVDGTIVCQQARLYPQTLTRPGDVVSTKASPAPCHFEEAPRLRRSNGLCRELACSGRARLMREMSNYLWEAGADFSDGITLKDGHCKVHISPLAEEEAISVEAIGGRESERLDICKKYSALAENFGGKLK